MTALVRLLRTTAFKIVAVYLVVFALFASGVIFYLARHTQILVREQITETIDAEVRGLYEQYNIGGIRRLVAVVEARASQPGSSLYLITSFSGATLAGNVADVPTGTLESTGWREISYRRTEEGAEAKESVALVRVFVLPGGFRLLVGRDL